jgi:hypothetical protein
LTRPIGITAGGALYSLYRKNIPAEWWIGGPWAAFSSNICDQLVIDYKTKLFKILDLVLYGIYANVWPVVPIGNFPNVSIAIVNLLCAQTRATGVRINSTTLATASTKLLIGILSIHRALDEN